jgi:PKD repeat protein
VGTYTVIVTATNGVGSVTKTVMVTVTNPIPVADAGINQSVFVNATVTLNGSGSYDPNNNTPLAYRWSQTGGTPVSLNNTTKVTATFSAPAVPTVLIFALVVTDTGGAVSIADTIVVTMSDVAITGLSFATSPTPTASIAAFFTATVTAGTNVTYSWSFGDGARNNGNPTAHTYATLGTYTVVVTATNGTNSVVLTRTLMVASPIIVLPPIQYKIYLPLITR